jgi:hypothetical protein
MEIENVAYALVQVAPNFGSAAVIGSPVCVLYVRLAVETERRLARLTLLGWIVQAVSGAAFGAVGFYYYEELTDLQAIALGALGVKIGCTVSGIALGLVCLRLRVAQRVCCRAWRLQAALSVTALGACCGSTLVFLNVKVSPGRTSGCSVR